MKFRRPQLFVVMSWILVATLTISPLTAQSQTTTESAETASTDDPQPVLQDTVRTQVLSASPIVKPEASFSRFATRSTLLTPPPLPPRRWAGKAPGESKWIILAGIIAAGAVVAAILLWPDHNGGGGSDSRPGTIITAGSPTVTTPNR